ncbi:hypothetical protein SAMN02745245_00912 [Anaerosphaera aminiphila DSM 21120]|uniref:Fimbrial assembly protein n=1 Tax=Anaerosphaera aminiphila DSM 21120 TaxID=1120995 RepID=A0A1M5RI88_9FIRM|nr:hypothetical protein [Anaerosphaera aminiphila]SHH25759.1 hypothetical protein SAMN02745245_00912 [Anaerosphaera aminiphila DSM 21120]
MNIKFTKLQSEIILIVEDFKITVIDERERGEIIIPKNLIIDGEVKDKQHLFYLLKKYFENREISTKNTFKILFNSSKVISLNISSPILDNVDLKSMVAYEIKSSLPIDQDKYTIRFNKLKEKESYLINIFLVPNTVLSGYIELFENLKVNKCQYYYLNSILIENLEFDNIVNLGFENISILNSNSGKYVVRNYYNDDFLSLFNKYNIEYYNAISLIDDKFENIDDNIKEKFNYQSKIYIEERFGVLNKNLRDGSVIFTGNLLTDKVKDRISKLLKDRKLSFNIDYRLLNYQENLNFGKVEETKKLNKIYFFLIGLVLLNGLVYLHLGKVMSKKEENFQNLSLEKSKIQSEVSKLNTEQIKVDSDKLKLKLKEKENINDKINRAKYFEETFNILETEEHEDILFTDYSLEDTYLYVDGMSNSKDSVNKLVEKLKFKTDLIESNVADGIINFKIKIELGALN